MLYWGAPRTVAVTATTKKLVGQGDGTSWPQNEGIVIVLQLHIFIVGPYEPALPKGGRQMKIRELLEQLSKLDPQLEVLCYC